MGIQPYGAFFWLIFKYASVMIFSLSITEAWPDSQAPTTAYLFAKSALARGHKIFRVFFSGNGVLNASNLRCHQEEDFNISQQWQQLALEHDFELLVCVTAALNRGVLDQDEALRYKKPASNLADGFVISGLGQLVEAGIESDRLISFGGK